MVNRAEPEEVHEHSDPVCPVCLNPIEAKQAVTIDHGEVVQRAVLGQASGEAQVLRASRPSATSGVEETTSANTLVMALVSPGPRLGTS